MPARWMKQPNGKLARFSSIVDDFTHYNCTPEEAVEVEVEDFREAIQPKIARGIAREVNSPDGWNDSLQEGWLLARLARETPSRRFAAFTERYESWQKSVKAFRQANPERWPEPPDNS